MAHIVFFYVKENNMAHKPFPAAGRGTTVFTVVLILAIVAGILCPATVAGQETSAGLTQPAAAEVVNQTPQPKFIGACPTQGGGVEWIWVGRRGSVPPAGQFQCPEGTIPGVVGTADAHPEGRGGQDDLDGARASAVAPTNWDGRWCGVSATAVDSAGPGSAAIACIAAPPSPKSLKGDKGEKGEPGEPGRDGIDGESIVGPAGPPGASMVLAPFTGAAAGGDADGRLFVSAKIGLELRLEQFVLEAEVSGAHAPEGSLDRRWSGEVTARIGGAVHRSLDLLAVGKFGQESFDPLGGWMRRSWGAGAAVDFRPLALVSERWWAEVLEVHLQAVGGQEWQPGDLLEDARPTFGWEAGVNLRFPIGL